MSGVPSLTPPSGATSGLPNCKVCNHTNLVCDSFDFSPWPISQITHAEATPGVLSLSVGMTYLGSAVPSLCLSPHIPKALGVMDLRWGLRVLRHCPFRSFLLEA